MKTVEMKNTAGLPTLSLADLKAKYTPNALKQKKNRDVGDLKRSILAKGFVMPIFVWEEGKYIIDGAGRLIALEMLEYEGYEVPPVMYYPIAAKNLKEAKQLTLIASSQYGNVDEESGTDFMQDMGDTDLGFINVPGLNLEEIEIKIKPLLEEKKKKSTTIFKHKCPNCHTEF